MANSKQIKLLAETADVELIALIKSDSELASAIPDVIKDLESVLYYGTLLKIARLYAVAIIQRHMENPNAEALNEALELFYGIRKMERDDGRHLGWWTQSLNSFIRSLWCIRETKWIKKYHEAVFEGKKSLLSFGEYSHCTILVEEYCFWAKYGDDPSEFHMPLPSHYLHSWPGLSEVLAQTIEDVRDPNYTGREECDPEKHLRYSLPKLKMYE